MKTRDELTDQWYNSLRNTGYGYRDINSAIENAGAVGLISSRWSKAFGANKVFAQVQKKYLMLI